MIQRTAIIAAMALSPLAFPATALAGEGGGFSAYKVHLQVDRNGVPVCVQDDTVVAGASQLVPPVSQQPRMRVLQRVTSFPGSRDSKALLELQVFRDDGETSKLVVAPTLGLDLDTPQTYDVSTAQGTVRIRATVSGDSAPMPPAPDSPSPSREGEAEVPFEVMPTPGPI